MWLFSWPHPFSHPFCREKKRQQVQREERDCLKQCESGTELAMHPDAPRGLEPLRGATATCTHRFKEAVQVRGGWAWCCLQVIYGLRSCCPAGQPEGRGAQSGPVPVGKCDSAVLLFGLPGVWPVTGAARALCREPRCKQWLYKVSREDTRGGRELHDGKGQDTWGDNRSW